MNKKRYLLFFTLGSIFLAGFFVSRYEASVAQHRQAQADQGDVAAGDLLTLTQAGSIFRLQAGQHTSMALSQPITDAVPTDQGFIGVTRAKNSTSLELYDPQGKHLKTLLSGDAPVIEKMSWLAEPAISPDQKTIAFISDKDRLTSGIADNGLYIMELNSQKVQLEVKPEPSTGGYATPIFNPTDSTQLAYTAYTYNPNTYLPYSVIRLRDLQTHTDVTLTTEAQNAFQPAFSSDGKKMLFLSRNGEGSTVKIMLADLNNNQLANIRQLAEGEYAAPVFSLSGDRIYFFSAVKNQPFHLSTARITEAGLSEIKEIQTNGIIQANTTMTVSAAR